MSRRFDLVTERRPFGRIAAAVEDGRLHGLEIDRDDLGFRQGDVFIARVMQNLPGLKLTFLDLGDGLRAALRLPDPAPQPGGLILAQTVALPRRGHGEDKAARATTEIGFASPALVHYPQGRRIRLSPRLEGRGVRKDEFSGLPDRFGGGWLVRPAALMLSDEALISEGAALAETAKSALALAAAANAPEKLASGMDASARLVAGLPEGAVYERTAGMRLSDLSDDILALFRPRADLPCGGFLLVEQTAAAAVIDVNSGTCPDTTQVNRQAAAEAARQIRLRNLGGAVLVDFIAGLPGEDARLARHLSAALEDDPVAVEPRGPGPLGLTELFRPRRGAPLADLVESPEFLLS
jgi:Ribonuclease G/E